MCPSKIGDQYYKYLKIIFYTIIRFDSHCESNYFYLPKETYLDKFKRKTKMIKMNTFSMTEVWLIILVSGARHSARDYPQFL